MQLRGERYWTSGPLVKQTFKFMEINYPHRDYKYNLSYTSNDDEKYFTFYAVAKSSKSPMLILSPNGGIKVEFILFNYRSSPDGFCYGYEKENGCVISELPSCRNELEKFEDKRAYFGTKTNLIIHASSDPSLSDCMKFCWKKCNCIGFSSEDSITGMGCNIFTGSNEYKVDERGSVELVYLLVPRYSDTDTPPTINKPSKGRVCCNSYNSLWFLIYSFSSRCAS